MGWLRALLEALAGIFGFLRDRQLIEAGRREQGAADQEQVSKNVAAAEAAAATSDPVRDERLRKRFDRSRQTKKEEAE